MITPAYDITIGGTSILERLQGRAVAITVTDSAGSESDTLSLEIEVGDRLVELPRKGAILAASLGYKETGLTYMGLYTADETRVSGMPLMIQVEAKSADMRASQKEHRTGQFVNRTVGQIVSEVAGRNGLAAAVSDALGSRLIPYLGQTEELDLNLLSRLARAHGAISAPKNGRWVFAERGSGLSASGQAMPVITLAPQMCTSFDIVMPDRPQVKEVRAHWHDRRDAARKIETAAAGGDESGFTLRHDFASQDEAKWAAEGKARELKAKGGSFSAVLPGTPLLGAETVVLTAGFYPGADFAWTVKTATHAMTPSGFTTSIDCELKP